MAATIHQGTYLGTTLVGFTALPAGLITRGDHPGAGWFVVIIGVGLLLYSGFGLYRSKRLEYMK
jgi:hypothetical protein